MADEWPGISGEAALVLRRRCVTGALEQWTVSAAGDALIVRRSRLHHGQPWRDTEGDAQFADLADVLKSVPELRVLSRGTISEYTVDTDAMDAPVLVSLLEAAPDGGAEVAADWPAETAGEWAESDASLQSWRAELDWVPRWARVNDVRVSALDLGTAEEPALRPVLADEDGEQLVPIAEIARSAWASDSAGAPMSWSGGNALSLLAPGLGYNQPLGDTAEVQNVIYPLITLPEAAQELGHALASWVIETEAEVAAAIALEPLDPDRGIDDMERRAWISRQARVTISFDLDVGDQTQHALRESLSRSGDLYRRTRDSLASPHSPDGQALAAALDHALASGSTRDLIAGEWDLAAG